MLCLILPDPPNTLGRWRDSRNDFGIPSQKMGTLRPRKLGLVTVQQLGAELVWEPNYAFHSLPHGPVRLSAFS